MGWLSDGVGKDVEHTKRETCFHHPRVKRPHATGNGAMHAGVDDVDCNGDRDGQ